MGNDEINPRTISRRDFLGFSASLVAAMSLGGLSSAGVSQAADIKFPEGSCGGQSQKKVLVAYASKYGSTGGVADAIGQELCSQGVAVDMALISHAHNIGSYQGVVIGSAIYRSRWMSEAVDFVKKNKDTLRRMPVAYFLVCMTMARPKEEDRAEVLSYMDPVFKAVPEIKPVAIGRFAGALHYDNLSFVTKKIMHSKGAPEGDFRDWNAIRAWAQEPVYAKLT